MFKFSFSNSFLHIAFSASAATRCLKKTAGWNDTQGRLVRMWMNRGKKIQSTSQHWPFFPCNEKEWLKWCVIAWGSWTARCWSSDSEISTVTAASVRGTKDGDTRIATRGWEGGNDNEMEYSAILTSPEFSFFSFWLGSCYKYYSWLNFVLLMNTILMWKCAVDF